MEKHELLRRIRSFSLEAARLSEDMVAGNFRSGFRGNGMEFEETRKYQQGDDLRNIDRNVSARCGEPYIKVYREEREFPVCVILDCSDSMFAAGTGALSRYEQAVLCASLVAYSGEKAGQAVSALVFDREVRAVLAPRKSRFQTLIIAESALNIAEHRAKQSALPYAEASGLAAALAGVQRVLKRRSLITVVSDFNDRDWQPGLARLRKKHDVIAVRIDDPLDLDFPKAGLIEASAPELASHSSLWRTFFPTNAKTFRLNWREEGFARKRVFEETCARARTEYVEVSTSDNAVAVLRAFFRRRKIAASMVSAGKREA